MLNEGSFRLDMRMLGDIALVLDASESAARYQGAVLQAAGELLEKLPAGMGKRLFFLGNGKEYECAAFPQQAAAWWRENAPRASLIKPVAERAAGARLVVIGSGTIFDLEDWEEEIGSRLILANVGDSPLRGEPGTGSELDHPEPAELLRLVHDPVETVGICGEGFLPYYWTNPEYRLALEGEAVLRASHPQNPAVAIAGWGNAIRARIQRSASCEEIMLEPGEVKVPAEWRALGGQESGIVRCAAGCADFTCPVCGKPHPPTTLRCYEDSSILGEPLFPSFAGRRGFILLRVTQDSVLYHSHPVNVFRLGENRAAVAVPGGARVYEYDDSRARWVESGELAPYAPVDGDYLLAI